MAHYLRRSIWHESDVKTMVRVFAIALNVRCKRAHILLHIVEIQIHLKVVHRCSILSLFHDALQDLHTCTENKEYHRNYIRARNLMSQ
jgi:hypothetical protein